MKKRRKSENLIFLGRIGSFGFWAERACPKPKMSSFIFWNSYIQTDNELKMPLKRFYEHIGKNY